MRNALLQNAAPCFVCGEATVVRVRVFPTHEAHEVVCLNAAAHGEVMNVPQAWRGKNAVATMQWVNRTVGGYRSRDGQRHLYPVSD